MHLTTTILALLSLPLLGHSARPKKDAVLLSKVETLTFRGHGAKTTARRVSAIPQLKCVSNRRICEIYEPEVIRCTNQGSSYGDEDIEWSCTASLPRELKLGSTEVICEGYSSAEDPYVLKGSCGVEYTLVLTDEGEERYPDLAGGGWFGGGGGKGSGVPWLFIIIFFGILACIIYSARERAAGREPLGGGQRPGWGGGGGGGGGWGPGWGPDNGDPPPPYPGTKPSVNVQAGWRPGFWSGLAGGAAAGYMAGGRRNNDDRRGGGSRWGSGGNGSSSGSSSFSSGSGSRHQSTGFGSTSRR